MNKRKILISSLIVIIFIAFSNYIGMKYNLYWVYKWYDIPMHILGGFCVGLFSLYLYSSFQKNIFTANYRRNFFIFLFFILFFITISWEIFELVSKITFINDQGYWIDTIGDILNAYFGGMVVYLFFIRNKKVE